MGTWTVDPRSLEAGGRVLAGLREIAAMGIVAAAVIGLAFVLDRVLGGDR